MEPSFQLAAYLGRAPQEIDAVMSTPPSARITMIPASSSAVRITSAPART